MLVTTLLLVLAAPDVPTLLSRVRTAYTSSPSFVVDFVQTYAPAGFAATTPETGRLTLQAPAQIRFDYDGTEGKVFAFDGKSARQYVAADRQMVVTTLSPEERARLPLLFFEAPEATLQRYETSLTPADNGLFELALTPKTGNEPRRLTLLATSEGEVKRLTVVDASGNRTTFTLTRKTPGRAQPAAAFALVPPKGTKILSDGGAPE